MLARTPPAELRLLLALQFNSKCLKIEIFSFLRLSPPHTATILLGLKIFGYKIGPSSQSNHGQPLTVPLFYVGVTLGCTDWRREWVFSIDSRFKKLSSFI